jgi:hypothetical protein
MPKGERVRIGQQGLLALVLCLVCLFIPAVGAQASQWHAASYPATVTTENNPSNTHVWNFGGVAIKCTGTTVHGSMASATPTFTFSVNFASCTGPFSVSFSFAPCDLEANLGATDSGRYKTSLDIVCASTYINIRFGTCEVQIPSQNGLASAYVKNASESESYDVLMEAEISGLLYKVTSDGFLCPLSGTGEKTNGTYTGKYEFFGESAGQSHIKIHATDT